MFTKCYKKLDLEFNELEKFVLQVNEFYLHFCWQNVPQVFKLTLWRETNRRAEKLVQ